jgi:prepilin-type N-terminal cleavage/methylation domain-containing protein
MKSPNTRANIRSAPGFTLVEIMIAVVIIGLLAMVAVPAIARTQRASQNNRFISDLRVFAQAFESSAMENGNWPPNAGDGVIPTGMTGSFRRATWINRTSVGGRWNWDFNNSGVTAAVAANNVTAPDLQMTLIDRRIDDGNLATGLFRKAGTRFLYVLEE